MAEFSRRDMLGAAARGRRGRGRNEHRDFRTGTAAVRADPGAARRRRAAVLPLPSRCVAPKTWDGGWAKEATVKEFPVSQAIAGVLMSLAPGGLRELHWHANAAEWAYVIKGQCRVTTIDPKGHSQDVDFGAGDVWYFPRGFGHSIQGLGSEGCLFVLVFDNGYFSEFGTFSISDWVGHIPSEVLAKYFGVPASTFANFPKREVYIAKGPVPPPLPPIPAPGTPITRPLTHRYRLLAQRPDTIRRHQPAGVAARVSDLDHRHRRAHAHQAGRPARAALASQRRRMAVLHRGPRPHERVRLARPRAPAEFNAGDVGYVPQGYGHYIENAGNEDLELLIVLNNGTYQSISLADWIGANPHLLLATNFQVPESTFKDFQTRDRFMPG